MHIQLSLVYKPIFTGFIFIDTIGHPWHYFLRKLSGCVYPVFLKNQNIPSRSARMNAYDWLSFVLLMIFPILCFLAYIFSTWKTRGQGWVECLIVISVFSVMSNMSYFSFRHYATSEIKRLRAESDKAGRQDTEKKPQSRLSMTSIH